MLRTSAIRVDWDSGPFLLRADGSRRCWKSDCAEKARTEDVSSSSSELPTSTILMRYPFGGSAPYGRCFRQSVDTQSDVERTTAHILPNVVASHLGSQSRHEAKSIWRYRWPSHIVSSSLRSFSLQNILITLPLLLS